MWARHVHWYRCSEWSSLSDNQLQSILIWDVYHCSKKFKIHNSSFTLLLIWSMQLRVKFTYPCPMSLPDPETFCTNSFSIIYDAVHINRYFTVKLKIDPIKLPSSYLDNFDNVASKTDMSLLIMPWFMVASVLSIWSSIFVWYWCYNKTQV